MKKVNNYNDFIFDLIIEKIKSKELNLIISTKLMSLLRKINHHKITQHLIKEFDKPDGDYKITLLDIDDKEENFDKFIIAQSNKVYDISNKVLKDKYFLDQDCNLTQVNAFIIGLTDRSIEAVFNKIRTPMSIGRVINRLFPDMFSNAGDPNESIESFVDAIKGERTKELGIFKLVEGDDIVKYYNMYHYEENSGGSSLGNSCMKYSNCENYIKFYSKNKDVVKLLILMSKTGKDVISGRALVWNVSVVDDEGNEIEQRIFMDRIYTVQTSDEQKFKNYASKNEWLYKERQNMNSNEYIIDTKTGESKQLNLIVKNIQTHKAYPYMDTIKYIEFGTKELSNSDEIIDYDAKLESTKGGYIDNTGDIYLYSENDGEIVSEDDYRDNQTYCDYEGEWVDQDEAHWSDYLNSYVSDWFRDNRMVYSETMDDLILKDDSIYIDNISDYVSSDYADNNCYYCDMNDEWYIDEDDVVYSDKQGWVPKDQSVIVYLDMDGKKIDYRYMNDEYIKYYNGKEYYSNKLKDNFVQVIVDIDENIKQNFKKEEDKNKYFMYKGKYYHRKFKDNMTGQLKLWDDKNLYNE